MNNIELESVVNAKLKVHLFKDYAFNGLQVEGKKQVNSIISGVSICQELLEHAIKKRVDAIIVHHGCFWNSELNIIRGIQRKRLKKLLSNDINLYAWHLPLDFHKTLGNNFHIGRKLNINYQNNITRYVPWGNLDRKMTGIEFCKKIKKTFFRTPFYFGATGPKYINKIAWCSGKGQSFIKQSGEFGVDAFITGEVSEETIHYAKEYKLHFFSIGHYASERNGIKYLGKWLKKNYDFHVEFLDVHNPI